MHLLDYWLDISVLLTVVCRVVLSLSHGTHHFLHFKLDQHRSFFASEIMQIQQFTRNLRLDDGQSYQIAAG